MRSHERLLVWFDFYYPWVKLPNLILKPLLRYIHIHSCIVHTKGLDRKVTVNYVGWPAVLRRRQWYIILLSMCVDYRTECNTGYRTQHWDSTRYRCIVNGKLSSQHFTAKLFWVPTGGVNWRLIAWRVCDWLLLVHMRQTDEMSSRDGCAC